MRETNSKMLKEWIENRKIKNPNYLAIFAINARISVSTLNKMIYSYYTPATHVRFMVSHLTGIDEDILFPLVSDEGEF